MASRRKQDWRKEPVLSEPEELGSDEWLTHCGDKRHGFRDQPWWERGDLDISVVRGRLDVVDAVSKAFGRTYVTRHDTVRYFKVGTLEGNGYAPRHTPSARNPDHVGIFAPTDGNDQDEHRQWWENSRRVTLEKIAVTNS